jgi:hypothetical protein
MQEQMANLNKIADHLWGDWRPKPPRVQGSLAKTPTSAERQSALLPC